MRTVIASFALWAMSAAAGLADGSNLRSLLTADDTRGYEAVGRIDLGPGSFCTGTLIADDLVLTAGHCLYDSDTGQRRSTAGIEFRAGWRDGRALAYRGVRQAFVHPDYRYDDSGTSTERVVNDLAILELDRPIRNGSIKPMGTEAKPRKGDKVGVVSYAVNREERPSLEELCDVLARPFRILVVSCNVDFGASGAPIFTLGSGEPRIVSVVSAKAESDGRPVSLGTDLEQPLARLLEIARSESGQFAAPTPGVRRIGSAGQTAKFVKP